MHRIKMLKGDSRGKHLESIVDEQKNIPSRVTQKKSTHPTFNSNKWKNKTRFQWRPTTLETSPLTDR